MPTLPLKMLLGTGNKNKLAELQAMFHGLPFTLVAPAAVGGVPEVNENRDSFRGNALKKAEEIAAATGRVVIADDSGLEVAVLGGAPGVFSARYAGPEASDEDNVEKLLKALEGVPREKREARFRCVLAVVDPTGGFFPDPIVVDGSCSGHITLARRGFGGFGYDPVFELASGKTTAEISPVEKAKISHRGAATRALRAVFESM